MDNELRRIDDGRFKQMEEHLVGIVATQDKMMNNHLEHIADDIKTLHSKTDDQTKLINDINMKVSTNTTDLEWLKKFFWVIATGMVGIIISQFFIQ